MFGTGGASLLRTLYGPAPYPHHLDRPICSCRTGPGRRKSWAAAFRFKRIDIQVRYNLVVNWLENNRIDGGRKNGSMPAQQHENLLKERQVVNEPLLIQLHRVPEASKRYCLDTETLWREKTVQAECLDPRGEVAPRAARASQRNPEQAAKPSDWRSRAGDSSANEAGGNDARQIALPADRAHRLACVEPVTVHAHHIRWQQFLQNGSRTLVQLCSPSLVRQLDELNPGPANFIPRFE